MLLVTLHRCSPHIYLQMPSYHESLTISSRSPSRRPYSAISVVAAPLLPLYPIQNPNLLFYIYPMSSSHTPIPHPIKLHLQFNLTQRQHPNLNTPFISPTSLIFPPPQHHLSRRQQYAVSMSSFSIATAIYYHICLTLSSYTPLKRLLTIR